MRTDLDGFTHFRELAGIFTLARRVILSSSASASRDAGDIALLLAVMFTAILPVPSLAGPADLTSSFVQPGDLPKLVAAVPQVSGKAFPESERVLNMERVTLNPSVLGFPAFTVNLTDRDFVAERVDSKQHAFSEMFLYRVEGEVILSTFTKSYTGIVYGQIHARGKSYFLSQEGVHYILASSVHVPTPEVVHYPLLTQPLPPFTAFSSASGKHRAVRSGSLPPTVWVNIAICFDYRDAVGGAEKAIARVQHMIDRQNNAYRTSGFNGSVAIREIFFIDPPNEVIERGLYTWAIDPAGPIAEMRRRSKAAATVILSKGTHISEALRTAPQPINPNIEVAVCGGFFAEWDDGDIFTALHEIGHLSGGDHNPESSRYGPDDPQITARDWYSCEEGIYGLLSYNVCDKWLHKIEMYSGLNAVYAGKVRGNEKQNNVGTFVKVFEFMKGAHE